MRTFAQICAVLRAGDTLGGSLCRGGQDPVDVPQGSPWLLTLTLTLTCGKYIMEQRRWKQGGPLGDDEDRSGSDGA